jgi:hypothetical protein
MTFGSARMGTVGNSKNAEGSGRLSSVGPVNAFDELGGGLGGMRIEERIGDSHNATDPSFENVA